MDSSQTHSLNQQLNNLLDKFNNNSSTKGRLSENILSNILSKLYPTAEVTDTRDTSHSCDIKLRRLNGCPDILFENKNYTRSVNTDEVKKFQDDINTHNCCGIMLSQQCGIVYKSDYQIDLSPSNKVMVYLHNVDYDGEKIKLAVQIIDHLQDALDKLDSTSESDIGGSLRIEKEMLDQINHEYSNFVRNRESLISYLKETNTEAILKVRNMEMPHIMNMLGIVHGGGSKVVSKQNGGYGCKLCNCFVGKTRKELCEHKKTCLKT